MGWTYGYLISWVAGGVLLAADLLLGTRASATLPTATPPTAPVPTELAASAPGAAEVTAEAGAAVPATAAQPGSRLGLLWLGLVGFGGVGLALTATDAVDGPLRALSAYAGGLLLAGCAALLRPRSSASA